MIIDRSFDIQKYLASKGFNIETTTGKRTTLRTTYFDAWNDQEVEVLVILHHHFGRNRFMCLAGEMMEVWKEDPQQVDNQYEVIYKGLQPQCFEYAENLIEMVLPLKEEFEAVNWLAFE
jgi:hypothetical protein